ncbi:hypothetical protein [Streptomyces sp. NPDC057287]|uniref:hypothetical protein n=1 Tax=Streptomyces sp. NPDC057287 TaxID=3346086 RepID=UPI003633DF56
MEMNQALATSGGGVVAPRTQATLDARNEAPRDPARLTADVGRAANTGLTLPDYGHLV